MKNNDTFVDRKSSVEYTKFEDISDAGPQLSEDQLRLVCGAAARRPYEPSSCTYNNDTD